MSTTSQSAPPNSTSTSAIPTSFTAQKGEIRTFRYRGSITKQWFTTDNPFEQRFGYHRAVRKGPFIFVSGTTALKDVEPLPPHNRNQSKPSKAGNQQSSTSYPAGQGKGSVRAIAPGVPEAQLPDQSAPPAYQSHDPTPSNFFAHGREQSAEQVEKLLQQGTGPGSNGKGEGGHSVTVSKVHFPTDARMQAQIAMERCVSAVERLGGQRQDIVRVKMFVSRHEDCGAVGEAYRECFGACDVSEPDSYAARVGAAATMIVVQNGFVDPDILAEIEVDAVV